ncbi:MAG: hypothetical protein Q9225_004021 [Loekoesia sp. 1 TL-2023]
MMQSKGIILRRQANTFLRHVDALEAKVRELERSGQSLHERPDVSQDSPLSVIGTSPQEGNTNGTRGNFNINGSVADASSSSLPHGAKQRYGKSSSLHFALNVKASAIAMSERSDHEQSPSSQNGDAGGAEDVEEEWLVEYSARSPGMSQFLPHRHVAKVLFEKYFEAVHPIWPFLLEHESRELFSQTWTSEEPPDPLWMVQLNLIMCLGCQQFESETDGSSKLASFDATGSGKDFYQHAQGYVYANAFTAGSVRMLQVLLLLAIYQQGAMRFNEFYLTVGHAARIAQSLGLHISRPEIEAVQPEQREVRRRLWWGCFCMDRMLCGRPMGIPFGEFSDYQDLLPQQVDDAYIAHGQPQPNGIPSKNSFFRHSVRLYHVADHVFMRLRNAKKAAYFDLQGASADMRIQTPISNINALISLFNTIFQLDGHLLSWHEYLPSHL